MHRDVARVRDSIVVAVLSGSTLDLEAVVDSIQVAVVGHTRSGEHIASSVDPRTTYGVRRVFAEKTGHHRWTKASVTQQKGRTVSSKHASDHRRCCVVKPQPAQGIVRKVAVRDGRSEASDHMEGAFRRLPKLAIANGHGGGTGLDSKRCCMIDHRVERIVGATSGATAGAAGNEELQCRNAAYETAVIDDTWHGARGRGERDGAAIQGCLG
jgi:hypothetical protein